MRRDQFHILVFCWPRVIPNVLEICRQLEHFDGRKTVIDASPGPAPTVTAGWDWVKIHPDSYYGSQFEAALARMNEEACLLIVGDMESPDWVAAATVCSDRLDAFPTIGVWSAEVDNTAWPTQATRIRAIPDTEMQIVRQTDCCVWALRRPIVARLRQLTFGMNNLGWGIDWAAMAICFGNGMVAVRDPKVMIHHPPGTHYQGGEATAQMNRFLDQLNEGEKALVQLLSTPIAAR